MASLRYTSRNGGGANRYRHAFVLEAMGATNRTSFSDDRTIPSGTSGSYSITGVGFQPDFVCIIGINTTEEEQSDISHTWDGIHGMHIGMATASAQWGGSVAAPDLPSGGPRRYRAWSNSALMYVVNTSGALACRATLSSFDADGFTLNFTDATDNDMLCIFLAVQGGSYAVGTTAAPVAVGMQSVSGLGFQPSAVFFASVQAAAIQTIADDWRWVFGGASDPSFFGSADPIPQYACWAGARRFDNYSHKLLYGNTSLFYAIDAGPVGPPTEPFNPTVTARATLDSFDADGFTLNWDYFDTSFTGENPTGRYYGWLAVDGPAEVVRWIYNHVGDNQKGGVATRTRPRAALFFNNQLGFECDFPSHDDIAVDPAEIGFGVCDRYGGQGHISCAEWSQPPFDIEQTASNIYPSEAFGALDGQVGGFGNIGNTGDDRGVVYFVGRDHLLRMHVAQ